MKLYFNRSSVSYTKALIQLFESIYITDPESNQVIYNLPIVYGDFNKYSIARKYIEKNGSSILSSYDQVPIAALRLKGFNFDESRDVTNTVTKSISESITTGSVFSFRTPIPVNYEYALTIWVRTFEHMNQVTEQLFPYLCRQFALPLKDFFDIDGVQRQVMVKMSTTSADIGHNDQEDNSTADNYKTMEINFDFTLYGIMHFPVSLVDTKIEAITVEIQDKNDGNKGIVSNNAESLSEYLNIIEQDRVEKMKSKGGFISNNGICDILNYVTNPETDMIHTMEQHPDVPITK